MTSEDTYDVVIVGAAAAGLAASIYAARDRYSTLLLEKNPFPGGQIMLTGQIENFPGHRSISGPDLIKEMTEQVEGFGAQVATRQAVTGIRRRDDGLLEVRVNDGEKTYCSRAVILAPGSRHRQLGVPGEAEMREAGRASYCAVCDGPFYHDKDVLVVGGGNTAVEDAIYLAEQFARSVTLVHRRREFRAQRILVERLQEMARTKSVHLKLPYVVRKIEPGDNQTAIARVVLENVETKRTESAAVDGVFILIGTTPNTEFLRGTVEMDDHGYIACDPRTLQTSTPGIFVAGDCRQGACMQLVTACADGAIAALMLKEYFRRPAAWDRGEREKASLWGY